MPGTDLQRQLELWRKYGETHDPSVREQLILEYAELIK